MYLYRLVAFFDIKPHKLVALSSLPVLVELGRLI